jgi:hypothetical protein
MLLSLRFKPCVFLGGASLARRRKVRHHIGVDQYPQAGAS